VQVGSTTTWTKTSSGGSSAWSLAIKSDNTMWAWGSNTYGQLGNGNSYSQSSPVQVGGSWTSCCAGFNSAFAIRTDGTLYAWGQNNAVSWEMAL
jgi:alpha-tubulin suppressor-like RCC1 family protein